MAELIDGKDLTAAEVRQGILSKITRKLTLAADVDLASLAGRTEKFSGAGLTELKELAVQAAIEGNSFAEGKHVLLKRLAKTGRNPPRC